MESKQSSKKEDNIWGRFSNLAEQSMITEEIKESSKTEAPEIDLEIEYVYGYRAQDGQQNLRYTSTGKAVYHTAALGVTLDPKTNTQKTFGGEQTEMVAKNVADESKHHMDDILCLDMTPDRTLVATGQIGKNPTVHVWDPETMESICNYRVGANSRGISSIAISPCKRYVLTTDMSNDHKVTIWNVKKNKQVMQDKGGADMIIHSAWSQKVDDLRFATVSPKEIKFWHPADATKRLSVKGTFGSKHKMTNFSCVAFDNEGYAYTGGANGNIHIWDGTNTIERAIKGHTAEVTAIACVPGKVLSGSKDQKICIFSSNNGEYKQEKIIDFSGAFPKSIDHMNGKILIGLNNGSIFEIEEKTDKKQQLMASHHDGECWGLSLCEKTGQILTCGDDNKIMRFDFKNKKFIDQAKISDHASKNEKKIKAVTASTTSSFPKNQQARAIAVSKAGHVAVCNHFGKISIRSMSDLNKKIATLKDAEEWCEVMRYSPDEKMFAVGSHDNGVYIYEVNGDSYKLLKRFMKHSSYVTGLDWSADSTYVRSCCGAYSKLYWNITTLSQDSDGLKNTKDMVWDTLSMKIGYEVDGIYPSGEDGTHINAVNRSRDGKFVMTGDDFGLINIYRYPVLNLKHEAKSYGGHSEHIPTVEMTSDDTKVFTIGGGDKTIIQWKKK